MSKGYTQGSGKAPGKKGKAGKVVAVVLAGVILVCAGGVSGWFLNERFGKKAEIDHDNQLAFTPGEENGLMTLSTETVVAEGGNKVHRLTATLQPEGAEDSVDWSISWGETAVYWDGQEIGQDKVDKGEVTDYVTLTPTSAGACTADVVGIKGFGTQAIITASAHTNPEIKATCTVDYVMRIDKMNIRLEHNELTESRYNVYWNLIFNMTDGSNEEEAYQAALNPVAPSLKKLMPFPSVEYKYASGGEGALKGALASDDKLTEDEAIRSGARTTTPDTKGSFTYIITGEDLILSECALLRYAEALAYGMTYTRGMHDDIVFLYTDSPLRATWEEFRPLDVQFTGDLLTDGQFNLKAGNRPLRIKDVMVNRFTDQSVVDGEENFSLDDGNEKGILYDYEKYWADFSWDALKERLQASNSLTTGETMSKKSLVFKLEIPKTGQVGFYALEFSFPASAVSLDTGNLYL